MLTEEQKKNILKEYLDTIKNVTDEEYIRRVWIRCEGPEYDAYDETRCFFFDDYDYVINEYKDFKITEYQLATLKKFLHALDNLPYIDPFEEETLKSSEWQNVMILAKEVLKAFDYKKNPSV